MRRTLRQAGRCAKSPTLHLSRWCKENNHERCLKHVPNTEETVLLNFLAMRLQPLHLILPIMLTACAVPPSPQKPDSGMRITQAVAAPLTDLNLLRAKIPKALSDAKQSPYLLPKDATCAALTAEVQSLDEALGPDLDAPQSAEDPSLIERGTVAAGDAAIGALRGAAEGLVPYRGWVRKLTGAERHSKEVAASIAAGGVRRAYLKGIGQAQGCEAPAAPLHAKAPD